MHAKLQYLWNLNDTECVSDFKFYTFKFTQKCATILLPNYSIHWYNQSHIKSAVSRAPGTAATVRLTILGVDLSRACMWQLLLDFHLLYSALFRLAVGCWSLRGLFGHLFVMHNGWISWKTIHDQIRFDHLQLAHSSIPISTFVFLSLTGQQSTISTTCIWVYLCISESCPKCKDI